MAEESITLNKDELRTFARMVGEEIRAGSMSPQQREHEANRVVFDEQRRAKAATPPLFELPEIGGKEPCLAILDREHVFALRYGFAHVERHKSGGHESEIVHREPGTKARLTVRQALSAIGQPHTGHVSANTARWSEAEQLGALLRALLERHKAEVARYANEERDTQPIALTYAVEHSFIAVAVRGGKAGERRQIPLTEHPGAW